MIPKLRKFGIIFGPALFFLIIFLPTPEGMSDIAKIVLAMAALMIVWWITEAIPTYATALLPLGLLPVLGVAPIEDVAPEYMNPIVIMILGMFLIALAVEKSGLHKKIAFEMITRFGYEPKKIFLGVMVSGMALSALISNTTVVLILIPVVLSIIKSLENSGIKIPKKDKTLLFLALAYSTVFGATVLLVGGTPNLIYASIVKDMVGHEVTFAEWSLLGAPIAIIMLIITLKYFVKNLSKETSEIPSEQIKQILLTEKSEIGNITTEQKIVLFVLIGAIILMFTGPLWHPPDFNVTNAEIALLAGISLFILPKTRKESILTWDHVEKLPFGILFLLGGGLALAYAFNVSGLVEYFGQTLTFLNNIPYEIAFVITISIVIFLTNLKSSTAMAAIALPIFATLSILNDWPFLPTMFGLTVAISFAFLLPTGTPPNALVYEKGGVTIKEMIRHGFVINLIAIGVISFFTIFISRFVLTEI